MLSKNCLRVLVLIVLTLACSKRQSSQVSTPSTPASAPAAKGASIPIPNGKIRVAVTISMTGIAHLLDDPNVGGAKLVLFPNGSGFNPKHELLLLVPTRYSPAGLNTGPTPQMLGSTTIETYMYDSIAGGLQIDLSKSGFDPQIDPTLDYDATGDQTKESCPPNAPRESLHWLPNLQDLSHASGVMIDSDQTKPQPDSAVVSGRISITGGRLWAQVPSGASTFLFDTSNPGSDVVQAVSDRLNYTYHADVDANNPVVELWGGPYGAASAKLATATASKRLKTVYFVLANVPPKEFFTLVPNDALMHFKYFYGIYKPNIGSYQMATPKKGMNPEDSCGGGVGGGVECGPTRP